MYITFNGVEEDNDIYFNASFLLGRNSELVGKYRKMHITIFGYGLGYSLSLPVPVFDQTSNVFNKQGVAYRAVNLNVF